MTEPFDSECLLADSPSSSNFDNDELLEDVSQTSDDIEYKLNIPKVPFTNIERYSIMFQDVCDSYNISREGSRAMRHLINLIIADKNLGKNIKLAHYNVIIINTFFFKKKLPCTYIRHY